MYIFTISGLLRLNESETTLSYLNGAPTDIMLYDQFIFGLFLRK